MTIYNIIQHIIKLLSLYLLILILLNYILINIQSKVERKSAGPREHQLNNSTGRPGHRNRTCGQWKGSARMHCLILLLTNITKMYY